MPGSPGASNLLVDVLHTYGTKKFSLVHTQKKRPRWPDNGRSSWPSCLVLLTLSLGITADFGVTMHIAWARHMLDNREFVIGGGTQPSTEPIRAGGLDGSAAAEERDNYHRDAYVNDRNHASGAPSPGCR